MSENFLQKAETSVSRNEPIFDPKADSPLSDEDLGKKKERYELFDAEAELARIARELLGTTLKNFEPLGTGANAFDHLVFRLDTADGRAIVCRINTDALVAKHFPVETALYRAWRAAGIPSPDVYAVVMRDKPDGLDYMLLEHVGTTDLEKHLVYHPEEREGYARKTGEFLAGFHTVSVPGFGMLALDNGSLRGEQETWRDALLIRFEENLAYLLERELLSASQAEAARRAMAANAVLLDDKPGVTLHGDYHNANIIIDEARGKPVAAVDLSQARAGDPVFDMAFYGTYVPPEIFAVFCDGYFSRVGEPNDFERKLALYQLRIYLGKAKLRKRFGYEERIPAAIEGMERCLRQLL
ncbi:MAG: putative homoserine kinase type II (protein kinase fold) [Parcubacteria group bacterium Gr01-1014_49]|nr:MAG: putative homoserine kinase type II (protein kinase fold) [Parcubacteria group bacterium Gr01-1014_49]